MIVDRDRQHFLGAALADDVLIEHFEDFMRYRQAAFGILTAFVYFLADDVVAKIHAFVADEYGRPCNQLSNLVLTLAAERAIKQLLVLILGSFVTHTKLP